jgi:5-methylcytosine-specific restriction enzyme subunit McrC
VVTNVCVHLTSHATIGYVGRIPIRNIWLLMLYASELFRVREAKAIELEENPDDLPDLLAEILARTVEERQRRQLSLGYRSEQAVLHRVRGRINVLTTERRQLLPRGRVVCRFDNLTVDTPRNRFVRAALEAISRIVKRRDLAHRCRKLATDMKAMGVSGNPPTRAEMSADRFGHHDSNDRFMVTAAKLAFDLALPTEDSGKSILAMPDREERWMRRLYERAIGGFFNVVLSPQGWQVVCGGSLRWQIESHTEGIDKVLPTMRTDIVMDHRASGRRVLIDTKFNAILSSGWYREETLRSAYVYQIYAYLHSQKGRGDSLADRAEGLLLHPSIGNMVDETAVIQGHAIRFATVDLTAPTPSIRSQLLRLIEPAA